MFWLDKNSGLFGHLSLVINHWSLIIGYWSLVIGQVTSEF